MPKRAKTASAPRSDAALYLGKATEFSEAAKHALRQSQHDAAMLNAIHAAISAADAVTVGLSGLRSTDSDHQRVADLLLQVGRSGSLTTHVRQLRVLLSQKNMVEYESGRATAAEASDAVSRAKRIVDWARETVASGK